MAIPNLLLAIFVTDLLSRSNRTASEQGRETYLFVNNVDWLIVITSSFRINSLTIFVRTDANITLVCRMTCGQTYGFSPHHIRGPAICLAASQLN